MLTNKPDQAYLDDGAVAVSIPDQVASCALHHYHTNLSEQKGKPKRHQEWTVYAAIVAIDIVSSELWVVSCATGTKCTTQRHAGCILHDGHAEVLARRGLVRVLWGELLDKKRMNSEDSKGPSQSGAKSCIKFRKMSIPGKARKDLLVDNSMISMREDSTNSSSSSNNNRKKPHKYKLNPNIELHLYISDSPCGDASIYAVNVKDDRTNNINPAGTMSSPYEDIRSSNILFTGAKVVVSEANGVNVTDCGGDHQLLCLPTTSTIASNGETEHVPMRPAKTATTTTSSSSALSESITKSTIAREEIQVLGKVRTKAGRSNLPDHMRSTSMSCSDKIVLWGALGMQGSVLTNYLDPPIVPLRSVVVSRDVRLDEDNGHNQLDALQRAISNRVVKVWDSLQIKETSSSTGTTTLPEWKPMAPTLHIVSETFENGKAFMTCPTLRAGTSTANQTQIGTKRKRGDSDEDTGPINNNQTVANSATKVSPCGMSLNWNQAASDLEIVVGARGIKQGRKPKSDHDYKALASRLSRSKLLQDFLLPMHGLSSSTTTTTPPAAAEVPPTTLNPSTDSPHIGTVLRYQDFQTNDIDHIESYYQLKGIVSGTEWIEWKKRILSDVGGGPLAGWLRSVDDGTGDFNIRDHNEV